MFKKSLFELTLKRSSLHFTTPAAATHPLVPPFGERQRSPLDSENLIVSGIPIFRIQQRRRRTPLATPLQTIFPFCPTHTASPTAVPIQGAASLRSLVENKGMDPTDKGKRPLLQQAVSFGERQRSPLDSENLIVSGIPIFRIQQRRRRTPLATPLQTIFPFCPTSPNTPC